MASVCKQPATGIRFIAALQWDTVRISSIPGHLDDLVQQAAGLARVAGHFRHALLLASKSSSSVIIGKVDIMFLQNGKGWWDRASARWCRERRFLRWSSDLGLRCGFAGHVGLRGLSRQFQRVFTKSRDFLAWLGT